jgi:dTDP-4-amino-4,6-dideoxygalactose transaminase
MIDATIFEPITMIAPAREHAAIRGELTGAFLRVLDSEKFVLGPEVERFEQALAGTLGAAHALAVKSGTDALLLALMGLGIGPGDEVITTPFTFFATAGAIARLGATPVFVDVDDESLLMDVGRTEEAMTKATRAVVAVHLFGRLIDVDALESVARPRGIAVVEDAAQAHGARWGDRPAGSLGTLGCLSFFPSKNLGALGDGGAVVTSEEALDRRMRRLRVHGAEPKYVHHEVGGNFRMDAIQAAFLSVKLRFLVDSLAARRANAAYYVSRFQDAGLPADRLRYPSLDDPGRAFNVFTIRTPERARLQRELAARAIECAVYYPRPLHLQPCFSALGYGEGSFPLAERAAEECLSLPVHPHLAQRELERVSETVILTLR